MVESNGWPRNKVKKLQCRGQKGGGAKKIKGLNFLKSERTEEGRQGQREEKREEGKKERRSQSAHNLYFTV